MLATVLMIILVVTILGVTALGSASLEGKLAHNFQERSLAFQTAEHALKSGEQFLDSLTAEPVPCTVAPCTVWARNTLQTYATDIKQPWWESGDTSWWIGIGATSTEDTADSAGYYLIEERAFVKNSAQANTAGSGLNYYTVTALGVRKDSGAVVVLQSHYMKRFN